MTTTHTGAIGEAMPKTCAGLSGTEGDLLARRHQFDRLFREWKLAEIEPGTDASSEERKNWEAREQDDRRLQMGLDVLNFCAPYGHLCIIRDKLDVLIRYASTADKDMAPFERVVLQGLVVLRADIVNMGG
ncbi:hypothetical protein [Jiella marina]|uniref:hypothetical protein n=1 Tax=Jiella sp. LLJ827 TaxID=2917712 RepID=UPI002101CBFF|nr:hypothetical protein [Jiella sp. LLJ827]MCQ0986502.1 hypothetical protein [Jiella sp. LLJ827]